MRPDLDEVRRLSRLGNVVPVYKSVVADLLTPVSAFLKLRTGQSYAFLLESIEGGEKLARFSFLGCDPFLVLSVGGAGPEVAPGPANGCEHRHYSAGRRQEFFSDLRQTMSGYRAVQVAGLPPFTGGGVGYFGYDMVRLAEDIPQTGVDDLGANDAVIMFFRTVLAFDHLKNQIHIVANILVPDDDGEDLLEALYSEAAQAIERTEAILAGPLPEMSPQPSVSEIRPQSNFPRGDYIRAVERAKEHIVAGDIFQVVLSQRFCVDLPGTPFDVYRALRVVNPSPYMYFLEMPGTSIVGASPEMLVRVRGREISYRPIAGTRPRGSSESDDKALEGELLQDEKERAEHVMLVDLGRNDLGRVCRYGSVRVAEFMFVERYSHVMHLVSALEGELREGVDRFDALLACFPAGTVSGAPKVRAMEIIDELEPTKRGVYAGAVLYADFSGSLDSCIAIRTLVSRDGKGYIQAGGGIVADSVPDREYEETLNKARALIRALELAGRGLVE